MSIFIAKLFQNIKQSQYLLFLFSAMILINLIYYIYWLYYISYLFQLKDTHGLSLIYYYDQDDTQRVSHTLPTMELNLSLFELQTAMTWIIGWTLFFMAPYLIVYYILSIRSFSHQKHHQIIQAIAMIILHLMIQFLYIPLFISVSKDYYTIYQLTQESFHLNIEYHVILLIRHMIIYQITIGIMYFLFQTNLSRIILCLFYGIMIPLDQPILIILLGLGIFFLTQEIITFMTISQRNYLKKIAGHCTGIEK